MVVFPDEIVQQIFAELEDQLPLEKWQMYGAQLDHQGSATLRNLCLVCRQFRRIAQPLLYQTVIIEGLDGAKNIETLLLRALVENTQLGEQVRTVSLTDNIDHSAQMDILGEDTSKEIIGSAMKNLDLPPSLKRYRKGLLTRCGFAALIIAYMPHVQVVDCTTEGLSTPLSWLLSKSLDVRRRPMGFSHISQSVFFNDEDEDGDNEDQDEYQSISKATFANYCFPNLTEVRIRAVDDENGIQGAWVIEPLLLNPSLKILRTFGTAWYGVELSDFVWSTHKNYNLEYLDLVETYIDAEGLRTILTRCPNLKGIALRLPDEDRELLKQYDRDDGSLGDDCIINFNDFGDVLRKFSQNLEEFNFNTFFYDSYSTDYRCRGPIEGIIGSLRELKSLRHLKLSKEALIGESKPLLRLSEVLPESIETLYLHCGKVYELEDWVEFERELYNQDVYKLLLDGMPNLREIRVERYDDWDDFGQYNSDLDDVSYFDADDSEDYVKPEELDYFRSEYSYPKEAEWPAELLWTSSRRAFMRYVEYQHVSVTLSLCQGRYEWALLRCNSMRIKDGTFG
jgi:hypothetical protein